MEELFECPECNEKFEPVVTTTVENTDADGNRGIYLHCVTCPSCDEETCWYGRLA